MEESVKVENAAEKEARLLPTLALAYLGDAVLELLVRETLLAQGIRLPKELNLAARSFVTLEAQSDAAQKLLPLLSEDELAIYKRGRNAKPHTVPKHGERIQYLRATGLEALFGYLYKSGKEARLRELFALAFADAVREKREDSFRF